MREGRVGLPHIVERLTHTPTCLLQAGSQRPADRTRHTGPQPACVTPAQGPATPGRSPCCPAARPSARGRPSPRPSVPVSHPLSAGREVLELGADRFCRSGGRRWTLTRTAVGGSSGGGGEGSWDRVGSAVASGEAAGHEGDEGPLDVGFGVGHEAFVVPRVAAGPHRPRIRPFNHPALGQQDEALGVLGLGDDLDGDAQGGLGPGGELVSAIAVARPTSTISGCSAWRRVSRTRAASRSWTSAGVTSRSTRRPSWSTGRCRFLPLMCLSAS